MKIVDFPKRGEVSEGLVLMLEDLLERARAGELLSFHGAGSLSSREILTVTSETPDIFADLGGIQVVSARLAGFINE